MLLLSDFKGYTSDQQYAAIVRYQRQLDVSGNINSVLLPLEYALKRPASFFREFDVVGLKLIYLSSTDEVAAQTAAVRSLMSPSAKLVYFDGDDDLNVQWPEVLKKVDLYVKKHGFLDMGDYEKRYVGKSNLSDYVATTYGSHLTHESVSHSGPLAKSDIDRIHIAWNVALDDRIFELTQRGLTSPETHRPIDVCARATAHRDDWVLPLREVMATRLNEMSNEVRVALPTARVPLDEYYQELRSSKICVSPFGYGEICWRDFEAIVSGCLLVKPDMSHLRTAPNLFIPGVTYAPVAWDFSDLAEVCRTFLRDDALRLRTVQQAQQALTDALKPDWLIEQVRSIYDAALCR